MVSFGKLGSLALISGAALVSAASYHVNIDYEEYLDIYFHYRDGGDAVSVAADATGLVVTVDSNSVAASDCQILQSGMLVYSKDGSSDNTLITWDQYEVFHLTHDGSEIKYSSVDAQSCGPITSASAIVTTINNDIATKNVPIEHLSDIGALTSAVASSSVVTTTISGVVTSYTTFCPISSIYGKSVVTVTENDLVTSYTTFCPVSEVVLSPTPKTVTETITSCENNACSATTSESIAVETVAVTRSIENNGVESTYTNGATTNGGATNGDANNGGATNGGATTKATTVPQVQTSISSPQVQTLTSTAAPGDKTSYGTTIVYTSTGESTTAVYASTGKSVTAAAAQSTGSVSVYEGEANFLSINKLAVGMLAVGAAMI
ncbi:unnamed protein product [Kluyveromyces dobzhanskii CBS 2104]|uniref:WGS project CCBQ000000000 data, contig MAT n=1 Tax=Kluyveromyces dobzhanskii CBS 2104 TaxID=1427455 RepID=A0A0A8L3A7_9SACH|nr:unnamed protein product [Kluyveromyces dobzhanskii CBS 2104]